MDQEGGQKRNYTASQFVVVVEHAEQQIVALGTIDEAIGYFGPQILDLIDGNTPPGAVNVTIDAGPEKRGWAYRGGAMCLVRDELLAGDVTVQGVIDGMKHFSGGVTFYRTPEVVMFDPNLDGRYPVDGFHGV